MAKNLKLTTALSLKSQIAMQYVLCWQLVFISSKRNSESFLLKYISRFALFKLVANDTAV